VRSFEEALLHGFLVRLDQLEADRVLTPVITLDWLREFLDDGQRVIVEQVIGLRPSDYGVDTPYAGDIEPVPSDLVTVSGQQYTERRAAGAGRQVRPTAREASSRVHWRSPACDLMSHDHF
jgi:hypothetical protein